MKTRHFFTITLPAALLVLAIGLMRLLKLEALVERLQGKDHDSDGK